MSDARLTELERRVLGHLPIWVPDEQAHIALFNSPEDCRRTAELPYFAAFLAEDPHAVGVDVAGEIRHPVESECALLLDALVARGLAEHDDNEDGPRWRMTEAGLQALHSDPHVPDQIPGPVAIDLDPAKINSGAQA